MVKIVVCRTLFYLILNICLSFPDPMSPNNMLDPHGEAGGSPLTSPPATPLAVLLDDAVCQPLLGRRRTMSQSRWAKDRDRDRDEPRSSTPDFVVEVRVSMSKMTLFPPCPRV